MNEQIDIWLVGNTGLRSPNRIQDGFKVFAGSPFVGNLHGKDNEIGFMNYLNEKGIIQNEDGKDESGSHARKWRLMFAKNGFIYPQVKKKMENKKNWVLWMILLHSVDLFEGRHLSCGAGVLFACNECRAICYAGWNPLFFASEMVISHYVGT